MLARGARTAVTPGECALKCGRPIVPGERIAFVPGEGSAHVPCVARRSQDVPAAAGRGEAQEGMT